MADFVAKTLMGLEGVLAEELRNLGADNVKELKRAVAFSGDTEMMYRVNLNARTALNVLLPIRKFKIRDEEDLYRGVKRIKWDKYMNVDDTLSIDSFSASSRMKHSKYVALKSKDAIVDQFRDKYGQRPSVNTHQPKLRINVHISKEHECTISLDSSGDLLYKRGYRVSSVDAPINEILAAGLILLSGWKADGHFLDPMCGSGTIAIEAAMYANNIAPNANRKYFGFQGWKDFDADLWAKVKKEELDNRKDFPYTITAHDKDFKAISSVRHNIAQAGLEDRIELKRMRMERMQPIETPCTIIMNPPYDERLQHDDITAFYQMIASQLKKNCDGADAWIISSNIDALKLIGLRASKKIALLNGKLPCTYRKYEMYKGSIEE